MTLTLTSQHRTRTFASAAVILLIYVWIWTVAAHRIADPPHIGFANVFVTGTGDFEHFYRGALALRTGADLYASGVGGYIYPPLIAFVFAPLTYFTVQTAAWIMLVVNMIMGLISAWVISSEVMRRLEIGDSLDKTIFVVAVATFLASARLRSEFQMWQTNIFLDNYLGVRPSKS
jgi:hypothetical protein